MRITDAQDTNPNYIYRCGTAAEEITVLVTPTNEAAVQTSDSPSTARLSSFLQSTATATKSQKPVSEPTSGSSSPSDGGTETPSTSSSNTWKYAVIGVGCVVVITSLIGAIF